MLLFDHIPRTDQDFARYNEGTFEFLYRSAKPEFAAVRDRLEKWFSAYPDHLKCKLKTDFKKKMPDAFFELYCHQRLLDEGWKVEAQPTVQEGDKPFTPDFFIQKNGQAFYVEATIIKSKSNGEESYENRRNVVKEKIASRFSHRCAMCLEDLELFGKVDPNLRQLIEELDSFITHLENSSDQFNSLDKFDFEDDEIRIRISFFSPETVKPTSDGKFAIETGGFVVGNNIETLKKVVREKARRYRDLPHQLIIMINVINLRGLHKSDVEAALFGKRVSVLNTAGELTNFKEDNGLFSGGASTSMANVYKVLFTSVTAFHNGQEEVFEFENPNQ